MKIMHNIFSKLERAASLLALAFLASFTTSTAQALPRPTAASFAHGAQFTVAGYDAAKPALTNFPVLVRIAANSPSGFAYSQLQSPTNGADLCFIDMDGNGLPFEIDTWDTNGTSFVWVALPSMGQGTQFVMCWGGATSGKSVCGDNPFAGYKGVWHMNTVSPVDASGSGNNGAATGSPTVSSSGKIGSALSLSMTSDYVSCGTNQPNAELKDAFTVETWVNPASYSGNRCIFGKDKFISIRTESQTKINVTTPGKKDHPFDKLSLPDVGTWWHLAVTFQKTTSNGCKVYTNGVFAAQQYANDIDDQSNSTEIWFGKNQWGQNYTGLLDEMRLSAGIKSADWIAAAYATQSDPAFLTAGAAQTYEATAAPDVGLVVQSAAVGYTNATLTASVGSFGTDDTMTTDASWVDLLLVVSANDDLSDPLFSIPLDRVSTAPSSLPATISPLVTNTTYYAKLFATNSFGVAGESSSIFFTTLTPGAPSGTATFLERGFTTLAATGATTGFGTGGESAAMRLEASTDGFETVAAFSPDIDAAIDDPVVFIIENLAPDTTYALRLRITNDWGVATTIALPSTATRAVPFATTGIGWQFSQDGSTIDIVFGVSGIYDGASGTATLTYGGVEQGARDFNEAASLSWPGIAVVRENPVARVVLSAELAGQTYTQTFEATIAPGSTAVPVSDIMDHVSAETAVRVRPGDVVMLPELNGSEQYIVGNKLFASLDGNVLTALRPGIVGVHCIGNDSTTNTLAVLVLPEKIGSGDIYVFKESSITGSNNGLWCSAESWEKVGAETNGSYPQNPDDIAIVPYYSLDSKSVNLGGDVVVGGLYVGGYCDNKAYVTLGTNNSSYKRKISICRTDGEAAIVQLCSSSLDLGNNTYRTTLKFSDGLALVEFLSDTTLSGGWDGTNPNHPQGRFDFSSKTNSISDNVTVTLREMDTQPTGNSSCTVSLGNLAGGGTFWNRSSATVFIKGDSGAFAGLLRDSGHGAGTTDRTGPTFVRTVTTTNCAGAVVGWVARSGSEPSDDFRLGTGCFQTGGTYSYAIPEPHDPWFTKKGFSMHGGMLRMGSDSRSDWEKPDKRLVDFFSVGGGLNYFHGYNNDASKSFAWFEADSVVHEGTGTLRIRDQSLFESSNTNIAVILHGIAAYAVGSGEAPLTSNASSIVPWIVAQAGSKQDEDLRFAAFDANDRLSRIPHDKSATLSSYEPGDNVYVFKNGIALSADATFNSLSIINEERSKLLGEGRTLTLTSGGLILGDLHWMTGSSSIGTEDGGTANGYLVLGDATHPAYVWARGRFPAVDKYAPNEIWANVTALGGFVSAHTGALILGGDQRGIAGEIAVNAGSLQLGTAASICQLVRNLPIRIFANATLRLPNAESTKGAIVKFDGAAGWFGKVEIPAGVAAKCRKAYWRDYPETLEWQNLRRGVYTGDEATALANPKFIYDPERFSGEGTLEVLRDESAMPLVIRLK